MGKSDAEIAEEMKKLTKTSLTFEDFKAVARPPTESWLPIPSVPSFGLWSDLSDEELKKVFDKHDKDKGGTLDKKEIRDMFLELGRTKEEADKELKKVHSEEITFEQFRLMAKCPHLHIRTRWVSWIGFRGHRF